MWVAQVPSQGPCLGSSASLANRQVVYVQEIPHQHMVGPHSSSPFHQGQVRRMRMGTSQHEHMPCWQYCVLFPSTLLTGHPVPGNCRVWMRLLRRRLGLSHCFLAAFSQYSWSFRLVKQKVGNCWPAAAQGSAPSNSLLHLPPRNIGRWHGLIRITQLTELGPGAKVHQFEQMLVRQQYSAVHQRNNITLLEWEQPIQCNPT